VRGKESAMTDKELADLVRAEFIESCIDDGYGWRLRKLRRERLITERRRIWQHDLFNDGHVSPHDDWGDYD
jgi:hypothetical protein